MLCGKVIYPSKGLAMEAAKAHYKSRKRDTRKKKVHAYYCNDCGAWHISSGGMGSNGISGKKSHKKRKSLNITDSQEVISFRPKPQKNETLRIKTK